MAQNPVTEKQEEKREETREALTPPKGEKVPGRGSLLRIQLILSALILGGLFLLGKVSPQLSQNLLEPYRSYMERESYDPQPLVRFAWAQLTGNGLGGSGQSSKPWNYSEDSYLPQTPLSSPLQALWTTSNYGWRENPTGPGADFHTGIDLGAAEGTPVLAAAEGVVVKAAWSNSYGNYIVLSHEDHLMTLYAHMQYLFVRTGQRVDRQQVLGTSGATGNVTGPHLHFELIYREIGYDPQEALGL